MDVQQNVSFDADVKATCQMPERSFGRSKSEVELEEKMERRAKELEELIGLGHATLAEERCDIDSLDDDVSVSPVGHIDEDTSLSPAKRRRQSSHSWQLLFDYADEVSTQLQQIDRAYWSKSDGGVNQVNAFSKDASQSRYDVPGELLFVAEASTHVAEAATYASEKLQFARTKQKLSKAVKVQHAKVEGPLPERKADSYKLVQSNLSDSRQFWPEVSQLKKEMNALREKLREAKRERSRTTTMIQELQGDLVKLEATG